MGISQVTPTIVLYDSIGNFNHLGTWLVSVANMTNPPLVISISYAYYEAFFSQEEIDTWNTEAIKLGLQGVSIFTASGDTGVEGAYNDIAYCGYGPYFPATSPYITAVGATQGYVIYLTHIFTRIIFSSLSLTLFVLT